MKVKYPGCGRTTRVLRATDRSGRARTGRDFEGELRCCGRARERRRGRVGGASAGGRGIRGLISSAGLRPRALGRSPYTYTLAGLGRIRLAGRGSRASMSHRPGLASALGAPPYRRVRRVLPEGKDPGRGWRERVRADFHVIPCRDIGRHYLRY